MALEKFEEFEGMVTVRCYHCGETFSWNDLNSVADGKTSTVIEMLFHLSEHVDELESELSILKRSMEK